MSYQLISGRFTIAALVGLLMSLTQFGFSESTQDVAERFALADDREVVVSSLVPGSNDYFYYRCLLWQHQNKLTEVDAILPNWEVLHPTSSERDRIRLRQAVLWFDSNPVVGAERLANNLDLTFIQRADPVAGPSAPHIPSVLPDTMLSWDSLVHQAETGDSFAGWTEEGLIRRIAEIANPLRRRGMLNAISYPFFTGAVELILADLAEPGGDFGALDLHRRMTVEQLHICRGKRPSLLDDEDFVLTCVRALRQRQDSMALTVDRSSRLAWVNILAEFARDLPKSAELLRTFLALHQLEAAVRANQITPSLITAVMGRELPHAEKARNINAEQSAGKKPSNGTSLSEHGYAFIEATELPFVVDPQRVIREALEQVFITAPDTQAFVSLASEEWLRELFIETKLSHGIGDASQWLKRAKDSRFGERLSSRVEISFDRSAAEQYAGNAEVSLPLWIKNVPELRLRIFALNAVNYYRELQREPTVDMELTGIVPTAERSLVYSQSALVRHRERIPLPECDKPGFWLIEAIGGGQVARALLRKGSIQVRKEMRMDGEYLTIYDEAQQPIMNGMAWLGEQAVFANKEGLIRLPYVVESRKENIVLSGGDRAALISHQRAEEQWKLKPGIILEREQLIAGGRATALLRPRLLLNGQMMPFRAASEVLVTITTITHADSRQVTMVIPQGDPQLAEWVIPFTMPEQVEKVEINLSAKVRNQSLGEDIQLSQTDTTLINLDYWTDRIADVHLEQAADGWSLVCLGRAGETIAGEVLDVVLFSRYLQNGFHVTLATASDGRVRLGQLPNVNKIGWFSRKARIRSEAKYTLMNDGQTSRFGRMATARFLPTSLSIQAGVDVRLPITWSEANQGGTRLVRGNEKSIADDLTGELQVDRSTGVSVLVAKNLSVGNYLLITSIGTCPITVVSGVTHAGMVLSSYAMHDLDSATPLGVNAVTIADDVRIQITHATPSTRVHVFGLRFHPNGERSLITKKSLTKTYPYSRFWCEYRQGQPLDPETDYILNRAYAEKFPGVMLERPGLLLKPWIDDSFMAIGADGGAADMSGSRNGGGKRRSLSARGGSKVSESLAESWSSYDFLAGPGVLLANLQPDATGVVSLTSAQLGDARQLLIVACDAISEASTMLALSPRPLKTQERRLMKPLPADQHLVAQRQVQVIHPNKSITVRRGSLNRSRVCTSIEELFRMYQALAPDFGLREFAPLMSWPRLSDAERRDWYSNHASHDVHLFLWHKDRPFFDAIVRPYLANKLQKTFIDQWLLDEDLTSWLASDRHQRLSIFERILLARRLGGEAEKQELASLDKLFADLPDETVDMGRCIATAIVAHNQVQQAAQTRPPNKQPDSAVKLVEESQNNIVEINAPTQADLSVVYRDHEATKPYEERNWYGVAEMEPVLFYPSGFWRDYALWDGKGAFLSTRCLMATANPNEILVALALSNLPFFAIPVTWEELGAEVQQTTVAQSALLLSETVEPMPLNSGNAVIYQQMYRLDQLPEHNRGAQPVLGKLAPGKAYLSRSVVLNPTPVPVPIAVLAQIPSTAIPLYASAVTVAEERVIGAYGHATIDQALYLPHLSAITQFPTHIRVADAVITSSAPSVHAMELQTQTTTTDGWATDPQIIPNQLAQWPEERLRLESLAWRFSELKFWRQCVEIFERRRLYEDTLWSYSVLHHDAARMGVWLRSRNEVVKKLGQSLQSRWLNIDPLRDGGVIHVDLAPLTNARAHRLAGTSAIANELAAEQWHSLIDRLALEPQLSSRSRLELVYALTLQDRYTDATAQFSLIQRTDLVTQLQYDYLGAYLAFARGDLPQAAVFAAKGKDHPVTHWRLRFGEVLAQLDDIAGRPVTREQALREEQRQSIQAQQTPTFQASFRDPNTLTISATHISSCTVRWYRLDMEPLFSRAPFTTAVANHVTHVRAEIEQNILIPPTKNATVSVPEALRQQAVSVEIIAGGQRQILSSFSHALDIRMSPNSGQLLVLHAVTGKALPITYVKVYAENKAGDLAFFKDGYTDLRGRFDYASLGTGAAHRIKRFALFMSHEQAGSTVREVHAP